LDRLPATINDQALLALLSRVIGNHPAPEPTAELRLRFFQPGFSWQSLVDLAVAHDVLPPLVFALTQRSLLPPLPARLSEGARSAHVTSRLLAAYEEHLGRQKELTSQLHAAATALNGVGIVPVLLKGAVHLTADQIDWQEARAMRDLDILVRASEAEAAGLVLTSLGYGQDPDPPPLDRHLPEFWLPEGAGTVEIHTEALSFPARHALTTEEVFSRAVMQKFAGTTIRVLPSEWHLLHGMLHHQLSDRGHARRMLALKGLWEFSKVGSGLTTEGWRTIIAHAEERHILDMLSSWSVQAHGLFGLNVPQQLLAFPPGRKRAAATFRHASKPYRLRQTLFILDKLRFAFSPGTLRLRYADKGNGWQHALHHLGFLWRRRSRMVRRWLGQQ
jgi:hypothetical protein